MNLYKLLIQLINSLFIILYRRSLSYKILKSNLNKELTQTDLKQKHSILLYSFE